MKHEAVVDTWEMPCESIFYHGFVGATASRYTTVAVVGSRTAATAQPHLNQKRASFQTFPALENSSSRKLPGSDRRQAFLCLAGHEHDAAHHLSERQGR